MSEETNDDKLYKEDYKELRGLGLRLIKMSDDPSFKERYEELKGNFNRLVMLIKMADTDEKIKQLKKLECLYYPMYCETHNKLCPVFHFSMVKGKDTMNKHPKVSIPP